MVTLGEGTIGFPKKGLKGSRRYVIDSKGDVRLEVGKRTKTQCRGHAEKKGESDRSD